mmetsp:Transcript_20294/g.51391  ORF Transcript_20294/g.51391 Transcript_20294/m.51391 type:complete len:260 (-) Transcript_20294:174-953(-)
MNTKHPATLPSVGATMPFHSAFALPFPSPVLPAASPLLPDLLDLMSTLTDCTVSRSVLSSATPVQASTATPAPTCSAAARRKTDWGAAGLSASTGDRTRAFEADTAAAAHPNTASVAGLGSREDRRNPLTPLKWRRMNQADSAMRRAMLRASAATKPTAPARATPARHAAAWIAVNATSAALPTARPALSATACTNDSVTPLSASSRQYAQYTPSTSGASVTAQRSPYTKRIARYAYDGPNASPARPSIVTARTMSEST